LKFQNDGLQLNYTQVGNGQRTIIFLHGNGEDSSIYNAIADRLAELNYTVYLLDSRGHGQSDTVDRLDYHDMANDLLSFIKYLNLDNPTVYGFSDGGIVALLAVIKDDNIIDKILISGINLNPKGLKLRVRIPMWLSYFFTRNDKLRLMLTQPNIAINALRNIKTKIIIFYAEHDLVKKANSISVVNNARNAQIVTILEENHQSYVLNNEKLYKVLAPHIETSLTSMNY
jgi:pimeloyl-ACP methyl ester carboxylesterase